MTPLNLNAPAETMTKGLTGGVECRMLVGDSDIESVKDWPEGERPNA